jgi:aspartyl-tRNA(Asn)/glutamyl-tRNA(Gln) amidotransferase subunit C
MPRMSEPLTRAEVERIAELASLELTEAEVEVFTRQLAEILAYAEQVQRIDTAGVVPTAHVLGTLSVDRPDDPRPSLPRDELLAAAPDPALESGLFRVPRVIG